MGYKPYEFREQDAYDFARHVNIPAKPHGEELIFKNCPYCKGRGNGNEKSFSINLKTGAFSCFRASCKAKGNMITLSKDFDFSLGNEVDEYYRPRKKYRELPKMEKITPKIPAVEYMLSRGISEEVTTKYQITTQNGRDNVLVFPFFDAEGNLTFVKYRNTEYQKENGGNKEWCEAKCKPILFGMDQCDKSSRVLIITEGQMDSLSLVEAGYNNAVSVPTGAKGFTWIPYCWDWIKTNFDTIIVFGDHEKGKITLLEELQRRFGDMVKNVRPQDYKDCKDANEILRKYGKEQIAECINNATFPKTTQIIDLADVEDVDVFDIQKVATGIKQLDRLLYGGLPMGGVVLVYGKPGDGKSTFASQILVNAVRQNLHCFAYSGELPNYLFKAWIDFQIAGSQHIFEYSNRWGDRNFKISDANKQAISAWYRDKIFLYDNNSIAEEETKSLVTLIKQAIGRYGVKVVLLDNLMTAIDLEMDLSQDKYERQSLFIKKLSRIALMHNVLIVLVAHKRKNNFSTNENDEIAGSSDIVNLATLSIAYDRDDELGDGKRLIKVTKNRLFGKTEKKGFEMDFDEKSKRIYGQGDDKNVSYGWCDDDMQEDNGGFCEIPTSELQALPWEV